MTHEMTADEFFESLNGFDEIAVAKAFGDKPIALSKSDPMWFARSLVFVAKRREQLSDPDAKKYAMESTVKEINAFFREDEETDPENPVTPGGKELLSADPSPTISPGSAS